MDEFDRTVDEIGLAAIEALKEPEIDFNQREFAVRILETSLNYFRRRLTCHE